MYLSRIREALPRVRDNIARAAVRAGGREEDVTIVAVTKGHPRDAVDAALAVGLRDIGENRVHELEARVTAVSREAAIWHMIGHLQRNKVPRAVGLFDLLHSLDSLRLAERLSREAVERDLTLRVLVQVKTSGEEAKSGFSALEAPDALGRMLALPGLRVCGVMAMAPLTQDEHVLRSSFRRAREIFEQARHQAGFEPCHLSMGMTNDYEIAVEEGSTMVRLGTALLGERAG
ncbi:MAG: YggS family pyridoxal phosphate-dependent enzyme [Gemmatimonadetes bacterium]|nr:YggS family pyridoxal phosphate-dependent enzyme [Gemmatimonadota bacterium]